MPDDGKRDYRDYIGDGVYVEFDGSGVWLKANDFDHPTDEIYLEAGVLEALIRFAKRMGMEAVMSKEERERHAKATEETPADLGSRAAIAERTAKRRTG